MRAGIMTRLIEYEVIQDGDGHVEIIRGDNILQRLHITHTEVVYHFSGMLSLTHLDWPLLSTTCNPCP
jgi:hypothetical protein